VKLTKQKLIEIIKKELNEVEGLAGGDMNKDEAGINVGEEEAEVQREPAIDKIKALLKQINKPEEYEEVLEAILMHGNDITGKKEMLRNLQSQLPKFASAV
jgi:hypothetical protein|tara:strand:- start:1145 stop:1447 length:303 start_codon:yes stop_codon:yes gene_type:complete